MDLEHLSPDELDGLFFRDAKQRSALFARVMSHLLELCPRCKRGFAAWQERIRSQGTPAASYAEAIERAARSAADRADSWQAERRVATRQVRDLLARPSAERCRTVLESGELRGLALAEALVEESRNRLPGHPDQSLACAQLAKLVLLHSDLSSYSIQLYSLAMSRMANAMRVTGRLVEASEIFCDARFLLAAEGSGDRSLMAEIDTLEGSLRRDQRRFAEAVSLLRRAEFAYRSEGMPPHAARSLIKLAGVHRELDEFDRAVQSCHDALDLLATEDEPRLAFYARHNLAHALCDAGRPREAREALAENQAVLRLNDDPLSRLRVCWLEGKIARELREDEAAEAYLLTARHGFRSHGIAYDMALASLDLAILYTWQRRTGEVRRLAAEMVSVFEEHEIHREATAALILFRDAAELDRVTSELLAELATFLRHTQRDPSLEFQVAS